MTLRLLESSIAGYTAIPKTWLGRPHLVVPIVALVEGVIKAMNSDGPEYVSKELISRTPSNWNGRPIYVGHPLDARGNPIISNTPEMIEALSVGWVHNSKVDGNLKMEAWVDVERASHLAPTLLASLAAGEAMDVSIGAHVETDHSSGVFLGQKYTAAWQDLTPDHLALLPGERGACNYKMGCGVRAASGKDDAMDRLKAIAEFTGIAGLKFNEMELGELKTLRDIPKSERDTMDKKDFAGPNESFPIATQADVDAAAHLVGKAANPGTVKSKIKSIAKRKGLTLPKAWMSESPKAASFLGRLLSSLRTAQPADEMSDSDLRRKLSEELQEAEPGFSYIEAFFPVTNPDRVVYNCYEMDASGSRDYQSGSCLMQRAFTLGDNGVVTLDANAVEVEPVLNYEPVLMAEEPEVTAAAGKRHNKNDQKMIQGMHDHAVALGATCTDMKAAASADATADATASVTALCGKCGGNHADANKEHSIMDATKIKEFIAASKGKYTDADAKWLGEIPAERLDALTAAPAKTEENPAAKVEEPKVAATEPKPQTEDEWMKAAPESVQRVVKAAQAQEEATKKVLVASLKTACAGVFTEEQLLKKSNEELTQLAALAKVETAQVNFSGQGMPRALATKDDKDDYSAPDSYAEGIKALRGASKSVN